MGSPARRTAARAGGRVTLPLRATVPGRFVRRDRHFLAEVELPTGEVVTVHCPDPGSMRGLAVPGAAVRCSVHDNPRRKLRHTLELVRVGRVWAGTHPARANALVARALEAGALRDFAEYPLIEREVRADHSRIDFRLSGGADGRPYWLEVKSVSWVCGGKGRFPDSVTVRGTRHVAVLERLGARGGVRAALLFLVQRADCESVEPADAVDPAYGRALRRAARAGVKVLAWRARLSPSAIRLDAPLPVLL